MDDTREPPHSDKTDNVDRRLREYAHEMQDIKCGIHALDAIYNRESIATLCNRVRKHKWKTQKSTRMVKLDTRGGVSYNVKNLVKG